MISTYNILGKMENPLCVTVQRSAGFFYFATVKLGIIDILLFSPRHVKNFNCFSCPAARVFQMFCLPEEVKYDTLFRWKQSGGAGGSGRRIFDMLEELKQKVYEANMLGSLTLDRRSKTLKALKSLYFFVKFSFF